MDSVRKAYTRELTELQNDVLIYPHNVRVCLIEETRKHSSQLRRGASAFTEFFFPADEQLYFLMDEYSVKIVFALQEEGFEGASTNLHAHPQNVTNWTPVIGTIQHNAAHADEEGGHLKFGRIGDEELIVRHHHHHCVRCLSEGRG